MGRSSLVGTSLDPAARPQHAPADHRAQGAAPDQHQPRPEQPGRGQRDGEQDAPLAQIHALLASHERLPEQEQAKRDEPQDADGRQRPAAECQRVEQQQVAGQQEMRVP